MEPGKFLNKEQASRLLNVAMRRAKTDAGKVAVRDYFVIHLALSTGLRVMEISRLRCGDLFLDDRLCSVLVRSGKGNKKRQVFFAGSFRKHCRDYLKWKQTNNESTDNDAPLLVSSNTGENFTTRALQKAFKRCAKNACLESRYSIHCLRHTYACFLLKASDWNLRLVQKQLGHSKITTTQVYADVMMPQLEQALKKMYW